MRKALVALSFCYLLGATGSASSAPFDLLGTKMTILVPASQTNDASVTIQDEVPPGGGVPAHVHTREDEVFVVTQGQVRFWRGHDAIDAGPGAVVYMPRNVPHQFLNVGTTPAITVATIMPAGLEQMFLTISQRGLTVPKDQAAIIDLGKRYGITYLPPLGSEAGH